MATAASHCTSAYAHLRRHVVAAIAHRAHASRVLAQRCAEKSRMRMRILLTVHTCVQIA
jgi:hypothetical protein